MKKEYKKNIADKNKQRYGFIGLLFKRKKFARNKDIFSSCSQTSNFVI